MEQLYELSQIEIKELRIDLNEQFTNGIDYIDLKGTYEITTLVESIVRASNMCCVVIIYS